MAEFEIDYIHAGTHRVAVIYAESFKEAFEQFESMKQTGVIGDLILERIDAGFEIERRSAQE